MTTSADRGTTIRCFVDVHISFGGFIRDFWQQKIQGFSLRPTFMVIIYPGLSKAVLFWSLSMASGLMLNCVL